MNIRNQRFTAGSGSFNESAAQSGWMLNSVNPVTQVSNTVSVKTFNYPTGNVIRPRKSADLKSCEVMFRRDEKVRKNLKKLIFFIVTVSVAALIFMAGLAGRSKSRDLSSPSQKQVLVTATVQSGDTLWSIAQKYYTPQFGSVKKYVRAIQATNSMNSAYITPGMRIVVPVYED